ncbi:MAG TPA: hypothetical protein VGB91_09960 [Rhizomicrobium sp.]
MTDAGIAAKTGHGWEVWFARLDKAGAAKLDHKGITALLDRTFKPGPWWGQMIAVSYERARGLRAANQKCDGEFSVGVTRLFPVPLSRLHAAVTDTARWAQWMPIGAFAETSRTENKYLRARWKKDARIAIGFTAKGEDKAQVAFDIGRLSGTEAVEKERAAWKKAVDKLSKMLESD